MSDERTVSRDVTATLIPYGEQITLHEGTRVLITHRLGGNFTVTGQMGMAQVMGEDADAIGEQAPDPQGGSGTARADGAENHSGPPKDEDVWNALKSVYDPEIPVNIVDLGLIYSMEVEEMPQEDSGNEDSSETESEAEKEPAEASETDDASTLYRVVVKMTLTAPGCGMGPVIAEDARRRIVQVAGVEEAQVDIVWDPPWHQDMISEEGKMELGLL